MAKCSQTASEFIQGAYGPMIAVLCTDDAEIVCQKNNLNFVELIRPFSQLTSEAHIRDPLNLTHPVKGWKLRFVELSAPTPSKDVVNQLLSDVVVRTQGPDRANALSVEDQMKASTPWFEAFRDCFIQMVKPSDHEFIRHFLGCLFVVSSNNTDPLNAFQSLSSALDNQKPTDTIHSKWFSNNIFKYYLMIHDVTDGIQNKAEGIYQSMKSYYGSSICHMLMINSRSAEQHTPNLPDPWSQFIISTSKDTLEMFTDGRNKESNVEAEEEDEVVVDENFDPLIATQNNEENPAPVLIGPLSFDNDVENKKPSKNDGENNIDGRKTESHGPGATRQFSGGLLSQAGSNSGRHGACLTVSDHDRIKIFIHELAIRGLIPFIERSMRFLYDQITARKGLHKSFFHATKKWFGGGKPVGQTNSSLVPGIIYESDSPELLWRKLGDLAFLVQNYELAYNCYHTAKRDFNANHAWLYFAGALEMASISAFMTGQRQYPAHYMETCISTYVDACRQHQYATRATLFGVEAFKNRGMYSDASFALLKMTGEESDLLSAILLEQAAHCFLRTRPPRVRKYAFNMILAGHRYSKAAQRKHALRCYKHSLFIYQHKSWRMAEDHINFIIGRQSFNLRQLEDALLAFKEVLVGESLQSKEQQASYLKEFLFVFQQLDKKKQELSSVKSLPVLPLPKLQRNSAQVIFAYNPSTWYRDACENTNSVKPLLDQVLVNNSFEQVKTSEEIEVVGLHSFPDLQRVESTRWEQIELETYQRVNQVQSTPNFRNFTPCLTSTTNNAIKPRSVVNEKIGVEVILNNELKIPLTLSNLSLLWTFIYEEDDEDKRIGNEFEVKDDLVQTEVIEGFSISGNEKRPARLSVTPLRTGNLQITGIKYSLSSVTLCGPADNVNARSTTSADEAGSTVDLLGRLDISIRGPRLNSTKVERSSVMYGEDNRLNIMVVKPMPQLQVTFCGFPRSLLCGEFRQVKVTFSNKGKGPLHKLHLASSNPSLFAFDRAASDNVDIDVPDFQKKQVARSVKRVCKIFLPEDGLNSTIDVECAMWVQGQQRSGSSSEELLFYYESADDDPSMSHRTVRHQSTMKTSKSLAIRATAKRCKVTSFREKEQEDTEENNQLVVTLEVENLCLPDAQFRTFSVFQVSCVSKKWILKPLSHQKQDGVITINQGETVMTHFKAVKKRQVSEVSISNMSFTDKETNISSLPYWEFFRRSNTWKQLTGFEEETNSTMSVDLALIALWESSYIDSQFTKHRVYGQAEVAVITLAESISAPIMAQPAKKSSLTSSDVSTAGNTELYIKYTVECPEMLTHDFQKLRFCKVTVIVSLHNCSQFTLKAFVEMLADSLNSDTDSSVTKEEKPLGKSSQLSSNTPRSSLQYTNTFLWTGKRTKQVTLQPSQTMKLEFCAKIFKTGVFNLNHCRVLAVSDENEENNLLIAQKPPSASLLLVRSAEEHVQSGSVIQGGMPRLFDYDATQR